MFLDEKGRKIIVSTGIGNDTYAAYYRKPSGSLKRLVSKRFPVFGTYREARENLEREARRRKWKASL